MTPAARVRLGASVLLILAMLGTIGYVAIEGVSPAEALYMVVITVTTVGYGEVFSLSAAGRVLTMALIVLGVGTALYTSVAGLEIGFENLGGRRKRLRMDKDIAALNNHYIICGFGRVGTGTWEQMVEQEVPVVVVERSPQHAARARDAGALVIEGDATHNDVLEAAGIERAKALVACVREDSDNLVIVLSARALCPDLLVVSRATEEESESKLVMAGANRVVAPQRVGANRLAALALQPQLADFLDLVVAGNLVEFRVEQIKVDEHCPLVGMSLREAGIRERSGSLILAIQEGRRRLAINPDPGIVIAAGQVLVAIGTDEQVGRLEELLAGPAGDR